MSSVNLGRVQGAGVFYSSAASGTSVALSTVTPTSVKPLSGDTIVFSNGDLRTVTGISGTTITCGEIVGSVKGANGTRGSKWSTAESIPMPDGSQSAGDQFLTTGADNNGNVYEWGGQWILKGNIKGADAKFYIPLLSGSIGPAGTEPTSVSTGSFGTAANWSDNKAGEVGDVFNCIFENTNGGEVWFCTGVLTNATSNASFITVVKIGSSADSSGGDVPLYCAEVKSVAGAPMPNTAYSFNSSSFNRTPVVGDACAVFFKGSPTNTLFYATGTVSSISGTNVNIKVLTTVDLLTIPTKKYQHNIFIRSTDNFNNICFSFIYTEGTPLATVSTISGLLLGDGFNSAYKLVPAIGSQRITISAGEYAAANVIGVWANSTGSNLLIKRSYINNGSYVIEGVSLSTAEDFEVNDIVIEL